MAKNLKFDPVAKDQLFYDRWRYCISFRLDEVSCLKELDHDYIDSILERRKEWREMSRLRLARHSTKAGVATIMGRQRREITEVTELNLHQLADQLIGANVPFKLVTSVDHGWVYTNDLSLIETLSNDYELKNKQLTEAVVNRPKNSIRLKDSKYTHRSYFKIIKLGPKEKERIVNFFINQQEYLRMSPAVAGWILTPLTRTQDYFFIDHNGESWLVMLGLVKPGLIRKTVDIIAS